MNRHNYARVILTCLFHGGNWYLYPGNHLRAKDSYADPAGETKNDQNEWNDTLP